MKRFLAVVAILAALISMSIPLVAGATASKKVSIQMSIKDLTKPGAFRAYDELLLTVNVHVGGQSAKSGFVGLTSSDPKERRLCGIFEPAGKFNYCDIDFSNRGRFTITVGYDPAMTIPHHYIAKRSLVVRIGK
jgi:hypothetical protein